jgi:hypothetical protein
MIAIEAVKENRYFGIGRNSADRRMLLTVTISEAKGMKARQVGAVAGGWIIVHCRRFGNR